MSRTLSSIWFRFKSFLIKTASYNLANISSNEKCLLFNLVTKNSSLVTLGFNKTQSPLGLVNCMLSGLSYAVLDCTFWLFIANVPNISVNI